MKTKLIPMPAVVIMQALQWWQARKKRRPVTMGDMLRVKDLYMSYASFNN